MDLTLQYTLMLVAPLLAGAEGRHPQDGPDADVKIWIESSSVIAHVVLNLAFIDEVFELPREDEMLLAAPEYDLAREEMFAFLRENLKVEVDGIQVTPRAGAFEVQPPDFSLLQHFPRFGTRAMQKLRMKLEFPVKTAPSQVGMVWSAYPPDYVLEGPDGIPPLRVVAQVVGGGERTRVTFSQEEPEFIWHGRTGTRDDHFVQVPEPPKRSRLFLPLASLVLIAVSLATVAGARHGGPDRIRRFSAGAGAAALAWILWGSARISVPSPFSSTPAVPDEAQAQVIFESLHANIYRAFDYTDQEEVYDALARSVHGGLLEDLYTQVHHGLVMQEEGGAVSEVQAVRPLETRIEALGLVPPQGRPGFTVRCLWQVDGAVFHWGHSHWRTNEYEARYSVASTDAGWRITESQVLAQQRLDAAPFSAGDEQRAPGPTAGGDRPGNEF